MLKFKKVYSLIAILVVLSIGITMRSDAYALRVPMNQMRRIYSAIMQDYFKVKIGEESRSFKIRYAIAEEPFPEFIKIEKVSQGEFIVNVPKIDPKVSWTRETAMKIMIRPMAIFDIPMEHPFYNDLRKSIVTKVGKVLQVQFGYSDEDMELFYKRNTCLAMQEKVRSFLSERQFPKPPYEGVDSAKDSHRPGYSELETFGAIYSIMIGFIAGLPVDIHSLADLGYGQGIFLLCAQEHLSPEVQIFGYDNDPLYFSYDFRGYLKEIAPRLNLILSDLSDPNNPVWKRSFDVVTTNHVLEHIAHSPAEAGQHLEAWNKIAGKYLIVSIPFEGSEPGSPNHTIAFSKPQFISICQGVATKNGYRLILDFVDWGIVIFEHQTYLQEILENGAYIYKAALPGTNRLVEICLDPQTVKLMQELPVGVTLNIFGNQAIQMILGKNGAIAKTGKLDEGDLDLYFKDEKVLDDEIKARIIEKYGPDKFQRNTAPEAFDLFSRGVYSTNQLIIKLSSVGDGKFRIDFNPYMDEGVYDTFMNKKIRIANLTDLEGLMASPKDALRNAILGLIFSFRYGLDMDEEMFNFIQKALKIHMDKIGAITPKQMRLDKLFKYAPDPGEVINMFYKMGVLEDRMAVVIFDVLQDTGKIETILAGTSNISREALAKFLIELSRPGFLSRHLGFALKFREIASAL